MSKRKGATVPSKQWSCSELKDGQDELLAVKTEREDLGRTFGPVTVVLSIQGVNFQYWKNVFFFNSENGKKSKNTTFNHAKKTEKHNTCSGQIHSPNVTSM